MIESLMNNQLCNTKKILENIQHAHYTHKLSERKDRHLREKNSSIRMLSFVHKSFICLESLIPEVVHDGSFDIYAVK